MAGDQPDYKDTLNLPHTDFPMKASLAVREPERVAAWKEQQTYQYVENLRAQGPNAKTFLLHDGPPYANGNLHLGHVLNKVLKDVVVKFKRAQGYSSPYVPGWDCHGLPIELKSIEESGEREAAAVRAHCRTYADRFVDIQRDEFRRLGILGDWERPYLTMHPSFEAETLGALSELVTKGFVERGNKPVHWCISCETALAEAEVEYGEHKSHSLYAQFPIVDAKVDLPPDTALLIWTTTPWTLPANLAVAVAPDASYGVYPVANGRSVVIAESLAESAFQAIDGTVPEPWMRVQGADLAGSVYKHPFLDRNGTIYEGDFVALDTGTGMVHIAPGHGEDDYRLGMREGLEVYAPVDGQGKFVEVADWLDGTVVWAGNAKVLERLEQNHLIWSLSTFKHSYPHCWRCQKPIIFRATPQWFIRMSSHDLREKALAEIKKVNWIPDWGLDRIRAMVENRPDWCISRQRVWGVPIASLRCRDCGEEYLDAPFMKKVSEAFVDDSSDIWFTDQREELLKLAPECPACQGHNLAGGDEILDVWFDSGISWQAAIKQDDRLPDEVDLYLEGSDQHRGWFQSSLLLSTALQEKAPYENVLTHGFVVDGNGHKMSKSRGNVIAPSKIWDSMGAEILRIWCAAEDYRMDIRVSDVILKQGADAYRRIRNTLRFLLGNLSDFNPSEHAIAYADLEPVDKLALFHLSETEKRVKEGYEEYHFHLAFQRIHNWCNNELSSLYLDIVKDRLYVHGASSPTRRSCQTVMAKILDALVIMSAPILSFTAEEAYGYIPWAKHPTVFAELWPQADAGWSLNPEDQADWEFRTAVRDAVKAEIEPRRKAKEIGQSLQAEVAVHCTAAEKEKLEFFPDFLRKFLIVSKAAVVADLATSAGADMAIDVKIAEGEKCSRCWHYETQINDGICPRCAEVVSGGGKV